MVDREWDERDAEDTIEHLMSHVDIEDEIFDMDDPRWLIVETIGKESVGSSKVDYQDVDMDDEKGYLDKDDKKK